MKTKNTTKTMEPVCTLSTKNTAVIYARVSSVGDRQSTERQVNDLSDYALYKKLEVRKVFEEHISGAKKNEERPVLCQTLEYCKQNGISTLLVSELSRMGRNAFEVLASVKELLDCGINLYIQKEQFNLLGEDGKPSLLYHLPFAVRSEAICSQRRTIGTKTRFSKDSRTETRGI